MHHAVAIYTTARITSTLTASTTTCLALALVLAIIWQLPVGAFAGNITCVLIPIRTRATPLQHLPRRLSVRHT